jgi:hypothetical protein
MKDFQEMQRCSDMCLRETTLVIGKEKNGQSGAALDDIGMGEMRR